MPYPTTTISFNDSEPEPVARLDKLGLVMTTGDLFVIMPGNVSLFGRPEQIRRWLQAGLAALGDAPARFGAEAMADASA